MDRCCNVTMSNASVCLSVLFSLPLISSFLIFSVSTCFHFLFIFWVVFLSSSFSLFLPHTHLLIPSFPLKPPRFTHWHTLLSHNHTVLIKINDHDGELQSILVNSNFSKSNIVTNDSRTVEPISITTWKITQFPCKSPQSSGFRRERSISPNIQPSFSGCGGADVNCISAK